MDVGGCVAGAFVGHLTQTSRLFYLSEECLELVFGLFKVTWQVFSLERCEHRLSIQGQLLEVPHIV